MQPIGIKLTLDGQREVSQGLKQVGQDVTQLSTAGGKIGSLSQGMDKAALSAGQLRMATQQLPLQFQDIVVSLQAGQKPLTVLLQQGSQIAGSFGGAGAAAKAMAGYVAGLINPVTVLAGGVAALGVAYYQGSKEQDTFVKGIVTTGNASGVTTAQLREYARQIDQVVGTQAQAAAGLADFVQAGVRGGDELRRYTEAALMWEAATGQAVSTTAKQFADLQNAPLQAVLKLNEGTNFLTTSVYEQIKALEEQGDKAEAARVAMDALEGTMRDRSKQIAESLGYLERGWNAIARAAKEGWDAMLGVGRSATITDEIARVTAELDKRMTQPLAVDNEAMRGSREKGIANLKRELQLLMDKHALEELNAAAQAESARQTQARIAFDNKYSKALEEQVTLQQKLARARAEAEAAGKTEAETQKVLAYVTEEHNKSLKKGGAEAKAAQTSYQSLLSTINQKIVAMQEEAATGDKLTETEKLRAKLQEELNTKGRQFTAQQRADIEARLQVLDAVEQQAIATRNLAKAHEEDAKTLERLTAKRERSLEALQQSVIAAQDEERAAAMAAASNISTAEAVALLAQARAEDAYQQALANGEAPQTLYFLEKEMQARRQLAVVMGQRTVREANEKAAKEMAREWEKISRTVGDTLADYIMGGGKDAATYLKRLFSTLVLQPVVQWGVSGVMGMLGMGGIATGTAGALAGGSNIAGMASNISSIASFAKNAQSYFSVAKQFFTGSMSAGNAAGTLWANATGSGLDGLIASQGGWGTGGGSSLGGIGAAWPLAIVAGMVASNKLYDAGFHANSFDGIGKLLGGGKTLETNILGKLVGDKTANILTGAPVMGYVFNKLFGKKLAASGFGGTFGGDAGFEGHNWQYYKGGLFSGSSFVQTAMDSDTQQGLADQFLAVRSSVHALSDVLGLASEQINSYLHSINLTSFAMTQEQINAELESQFKAMADAMAGMVLASDAYSLAEERRYDTLVRLGSHLSSFNNTLEALGLTAYKAGVVAADGAYKIIAALGGLEQYGATMDAYYQAYYTESERVANTTKQLASVFEQFGTQLPSSAEAYRTLVEQQIAAAENGNAEAQAFAATLLGLAGTFKQVADSWKATITELTGEVSGLFASVYSEIKSIRAEIADDRKSILRGTDVMTADAIRAAIAGTALTAPSQIAALQAGNVTQNAAAAMAQAQQRLTGAKGVQAGADSVATSLYGQRAALESQRASVLDNWIVPWEYNWREWRKQYEVWAHLETPHLDAADALTAQIEAINRQLAEQATVQGIAAEAARQAQAAYDAAQQSYKDAQAAEVAAQKVYAQEVARHIAAASQNVQKLSDLRGEVMGFYEAQVQAVEAMLASAGNLRGIVDQLRMGQLSTAQTASELGARYAMDYSMALATTGSVRAGYVDSMSANLGNLTEALRAEAATGEEWRVKTAILFAQASNAANLLEGDAQSSDYQDVALELLDSIDTALNQLDGTAKSAEALIVEAIQSGTAANLDGLRAVVAALKGEAIPAFATGGAHLGGLRIVGENGPELEATGPSRIWNAQQLSSMLGGGGAASAAEIRAMRAELAQQRQENQAHALAMLDVMELVQRVLNRWDLQGMPEERPAQVVQA